MASLALCLSLVMGSEHIWTPPHTAVPQCTLTPGLVRGTSKAFHHTPTLSAADCCTVCLTMSQCAAFNWEPDTERHVPRGMCYLQRDASARTSPKNGTISGTPTSPLPPTTEVTVTVGHWYHTIDTGFKCWTIDASQNRGWEQRNLSDPKLRYLAAASLPGYMRFGGGGNDDLQYAVGQPKARCPPPENAVTPGDDGVGKRPPHCLNQTWFDNLMGFANASKARLVFGLSVNNSAGNGRWDPTQARDLIQYGIDKWGKDAFWGFELGNEQNSAYSAEQEAANFGILHSLVVELWPDTTPAQRPHLVGPDPHGYHNPKQAWANASRTRFLIEFSHNSSAKGVPIHALTHHEYVEVPQYLTHPPTADTLDKVGLIASEVNASLRDAGIQLPIWVGETGPHNGASPGVLSDRSMRWANFADTFWYLDAMGQKARHGYSVFCRQDFVGIDYGLLDPETNDPLPDYYAGILWSLLMGTKVIRTVSSASDSIRAYAHCSARSPTDLTLLLLNLQPANTSQPINVTLSGVPGCGSQSVCTRVEYRLSGPRGTNTTDIALNGVTLALTPEGRLPQMRGIETKGGDVIVMPPATIAFLEVRNAGKTVGC